MQQYETQKRKVEAMQLKRSNLGVAAIWCGGEIVDPDDGAYLVLEVPTLKGRLQIKVGQYLVKDISSGKFYGMGTAEFDSEFHKSGINENTPDQGSPTMIIYDPPSNPPASIAAINERTRSMMGHPSFPHFN